MRRALLAAIVCGAALLAPGLAAPASATTVSGACTTSKGVTVVVDFGKYGGTTTRCFAGATSSTDGVGALQGAGFSPAGTGNYGLAFICRINNLPPPSDESCATTPHATAYWTYWYASNGGPWTYSTKGAKNRTVIVGGFEGWSFHSGSGSNTLPTSGNPTRPAPPAPQPTIKLGPAASTSTTSSSHSSSSSTSASKRPTAAKTTATPGRTTSGPSASTSSAAPLASSTSGDSAGGALAAESPDGGGSPWPLVGGIAGVALILAGAAVVVLRRRGAGGY